MNMMQNLVLISLCLRLNIPCNPYSKNETANEDVVETFPVEVVEEESESLSNPYKDLIVTDAEKELLACMAYSEAGNQCFEGQVAWYKWRLIVICTMLFLAASARFF